MLMNGTAVETVASSWIEALGGVSMCWILRMPPDFCAHPLLAVVIAAANTASGISQPLRVFIWFPPLQLYAIPPELIRTEAKVLCGGEEGLASACRTAG